MDVLHPAACKLIYNDELKKYFKLELVCSFRVYGKPIPKGNHRAFISGNRAIITDSQGGTLSDWQDAIRVQAKKAYTVFGWTGAVALGMDFYFKHPAYHFTSKGQQSKSYTDVCTKAPDSDKLARSVFDALTGTVYSDDCFTMAERVYKYYGQEGVYVDIYHLHEVINGLL